MKLSAWRWFARLVLFLYIPFVLIAAGVAMYDPIWKAHQGWEGMAGFMASLAAGVPWTLLLMWLSAVYPGHLIDDPGTRDLTYFWLGWTFAGFNIFLLSIAAFPRRHSGQAPPLVKRP